MCVVKLIVFTYTMPQGYMHKHNITYIKYIYPTMCVCLSVGTSSCPLFVAHIKCDQNLQLSLFRWPMINCPIGKDNANCMQINITQANTTHTVGRTVGRMRREAAVNQKMNYAFFSVVLLVETTLCPGNIHSALLLSLAACRLFCSLIP